MRRQVIASLAAAVVSLLAQTSARSATLDYIPGPPGGPAPSSVDGVSGDGTVAAGTLVLIPGESQHLYRWTRGGGTVDLGRPLGRDFNLTTDVSDDGGTIVGWAFNDIAAGGTLQAFRWTPGGEYSSLGTVPGYLHSTANGVSADGSVVVGTVLNEGGRKWAPAGRPVPEWFSYCCPPARRGACLLTSAPTGRLRWGRRRRGPASARGAGRRPGPRCWRAW